jgi:hypothetical protein
MHTPLPTAERSQHHQELEALFKNWAQQSFIDSMAFMREVEHYQQVLQRIQAGEDLSDELVALTYQTKQSAVTVINSLIAQSTAGIEQAWSLKPNVVRLFTVSVRQRMYDLSAAPCFDVQYQAKTAEGFVTVHVTTWRRNITVTVEGAADAVDQLQGQLVMTGLQGLKSS